MNILGLGIKWKKLINIFTYNLYTRVFIVGVGGIFIWYGL